LRALRVAPACQLALDVDQTVTSAECWQRLSEETRAQVLTLLARLIARGVIADEGGADTGCDPGGNGRGAGRG
jgi:hypothetical protein